MGGPEMQESHWSEAALGVLLAALALGSPGTGQPSPLTSLFQPGRWGRRMRALPIPNVTCGEPLARSALYSYTLNQINLTKTDDL